MVVNTFLTDDEMVTLIKRENKYFSTNEMEEEIPQVEEELFQVKCIKHKAKLYSEKNSKTYQKVNLNNQL